MTFADPYLLLLLLAIPPLAFLKGRRRREGGAATFSTLGLLASYRPTWRIRYRWVPSAVRGLAITLIIVGIARPQTGRAESELPGKGIDIALVFDTSSSMSSFLGDDTRMQVAQRVLKDFIGGREEDRIGIVIFREQSLVLSPPTLDYEALKRLVDGVEQVNLPDGTAIGIGLADAVAMLRESKAISRVAILLTDGENNAGDIEPLSAARIAETLGVRLYTVGILDSGARGRGQANVDERALQEMANVTGGRYFPADSEEALSDIYQSIDVLEKSRVGRPQFAAYDELAAYFLAGALILLALEVGLLATVWRRAA